MGGEAPPRLRLRLDVVDREKDESEPQERRRGSNVGKGSQTGLGSIVNGAGNLRRVEVTSLARPPREVDAHPDRLDASPGYKGEIGPRSSARRGRLIKLDGESRELPEGLI